MFSSFIFVTFFAKLNGNDVEMSKEKVQPFLLRISCESSYCEVITKTILGISLTQLFLSVIIFSYFIYRYKHIQAELLYDSDIKRSIKKIKKVISEKNSINSENEDINSMTLSDLKKTHIKNRTFQKLTDTMPTGQ
ncbi:hypothetical protein SNEBB_008725 [Seison nebaliae]|nr:hypothetical protein SNEBB_008725 [Seison nebaliae]